MSGEGPDLLPIMSCIAVGSFLAGASGVDMARMNLGQKGGEPTDHGSTGTQRQTVTLYLQPRSPPTALNTEDKAPSAAFHRAREAPRPAQPPPAIAVSPTQSAQVNPNPAARLFATRCLLRRRELPSIPCASVVEQIACPPRPGRSKGSRGSGRKPVHHIKGKIPTVAQRPVNQPRSGHCLLHLGIAR